MTGISVTGANPTDYVQTTTCGAWIAGGTSCTVTVQFMPQAAFARSATLQINDSDPTSPQAVTLSGTGYAISVSPKTLTFPSTPLGSTSADKTVTVTNLGTAPVPVSSITVIGANPSDFQIGDCGTSIPGGASCTLTLTFTPQSAGSRSATLQINDSDPTSPQNVTLSGSGYALSVSPKTLTFPSTPLGSTSTSKTVTVTNLGTAPVPVSSITMIGANPSDFQTGNCGASISGGASCTLTLTFTPQSDGSRSATLQINDSDPTSPQNVTLSGSGYAVSVSPKTLTFPWTPLGSTSAGKTVTVTNLGAAAVPVSSITMIGANPSDFQAGNCGASIPGGASCTLTLTFTPQAAGSRSATLQINDSDPTSPQNVMLFGTGEAISFSPKTLSFPSTPLGSTSTGKTVTVTNLGTAPVPVTSITLIGANPSDFQTGNCGASIPGGASCTLTLTFSPQAAGSRSATLQINDSDPTSPQNVMLSGTGYAISVSPKTLTFLSTPLGSTSTSKTVTVTNLGTAPVPVSSITMIGANPSDFQAGNCGASIPGGASCTLTLTFTPQAAGSRSATLQINDSDPTSPQNVTLSGTGYAISVSTKSLAFPWTKVGSTSTGKTVMVTNLGSSPVAISSIAVTGTNPLDFQQTSDCGASIAGGTSCTITVTFTPQGTGTRNATLTIIDADPTSPQTVTLIGTGT